MFKNITLIFAALILFGGNLQAAEKHDLKWNFKEGQTFALQGSIALDGSAEIPQQMLLPPGQANASGVTGNEQATGNLLFNFGWTVTVKAVDKQGNADLLMELKSAVIKASGKLGEQELNYEADLMEPTLTQEGLQTMLKPEDTVNTWKVAPNGKVLAINNQEVDQTLATLQQELANAGIKVKASELREATDMFLYFMAIYPNKPVAVGEKWTRSVNLSNLLENGSDHDGVLVNNFELLLKQDWKVKNSNGSLLTLEENSTSMPKFSITLDGPEATISFSASGTEQSSVTVDRAKGRVSQSDQRLTISGYLNALEKKGENQEFKIPFQLKMQSQFSLTE